MATQIIGTCSRCDGPVEWDPRDTQSPPRCRRCGGRKAERAKYGPVIEMAPPPWPEAWWMRHGVRQ